MVDGHDTLKSSGYEPEFSIQDDAVAGLVELQIWPSLATATQSSPPVSVHEMAVMGTPNPAGGGATASKNEDHALTGPVGSVVVNTFPEPSTATQRLVDGHEIPVREPLGSMAIGGCHAPEGSLDHVMLCELPEVWLASIATQSPLDGHDVLATSG